MPGHFCEKPRIAAEKARGTREGSSQHSRPEASRGGGVPGGARDEKSERPARFYSVTMQNRGFA